MISACLGAVNQYLVPIIYSDQIQNLPGGAEVFWPDKGLKKAFAEYWNLRYSKFWKNCYEKEAPYFQEMVSRSRYENVVKTTHLNSIVNIEVRSIQKITSTFYEIQISLHVIGSNTEKKEILVTDRWVYVEGNWYHVIRDMFIFPNAS